MEILLIVFLSASTSIYLFARYQLWKKYSGVSFVTTRRPKPFKEIVQQVFPEFTEQESQASESNEPFSASSSTVSSQNQKALDSLSVMSALGESAWLGADMIRNLSDVNQHVFDALSQMAGKQLLSIGDLHDHIDSWEHDWLGGLKDSTINNLQGHVAEYIVADHLKELGHNVEIADHSNQTGYDLIVDGHPINVKDVVDMSSIHEHFQKYPDIPVILNADIHGNMDNALHIDATHAIDQIQNLDGLNAEHLVIQDVGLDHDTVLGQVHDASDAISGNIELHIPLITLTLSSFREGKLLLNKHTDIATSMKNIGLDVAGTGIGGFVGAKAGAAIGTAIAPGLGTAIGVVVGGIAGAIGGRLISNRVKTEPFRQARELYEKDIKSYESKVKDVDLKAKQDCDRVIAEETTRLDSCAKQESQHIESLKRTLIKKQNGAYSLDDASLLNLFDKARLVLQDELSSVNSQIKSLPFVQKYVWPSEAYFRLNKHKQNLLAVLRDLQTSNQVIFSSTTSLSSEEKTTATFEILCSIGILDADVSQHLSRYRETVDNTKSELSLSIESAKHRIADERHHSFRTISDTIQKIKTWAEKELSPFVDALKTSQQSLLSEMRKLGIETK